MRCEELMTRIGSASGRGTVSNAAAKMRDANVGFLPIIDDAEQVVGVLTTATVVRVMARACPSRPAPRSDDRGRELVRPEDDLERVETHARHHIVCR